MMNDIKAQAILSGATGSGVILLDEAGHVVAQLHLMSIERPDERLSRDEYRDRSNTLTDFIAGRINAPAHPSGIEEIAAERRRQVETEGFTTEHDDEHRAGELALGAAAYATRAAFSLSPTASLGHLALTLWPWSPHWFKPKTSREDLIRAAGLIAAEIERQDRAAARQEQSS